MELSAAVRASQAQPSGPAAAPSSPATAAAAAAPADELKTAKDEVERLKKELEQSTQRERSLKGRYDADVPKLREELKAAKDTVAELERKAKPVLPGTLRSITDAERNLAGEPMLELISKAAREIVEDTLDARFKPLNEQFQTLVRQTEAQFFATIEYLVPGWEVQNDDPSFIQWLNGNDPATGHSRYDRLRTAEALKQGYLVAEIFNAYREKREIGARTSAPAPKLDLSPPDGGTPPPPPPSGEDGRIISRNEIQNFYREKREGKWNGREKEARAFEIEIFEARKAGRVQ